MMKVPAKVTIGMCLKNSEATIREAMESVIDQEFPQELMELIVVDGSSRDGTLSLVKDYLDKASLHGRIFSEDKGLGQARQIVVDNAEGEYIIWVDGDMLLSSNFVKNQVEFMDKNPDIGIAKGRLQLKQGPNLLSTLEIYARASDKMVDYRVEKARLKSLGTSGCIYRVEAIRQVGGFDRNIKGYGEDWDAEYRVRAAGWSLCTIEVQYRDYERFGLSWKDLWRRYRRIGYDMHYFFQKHKDAIKLYRMLPAFAFLSGLFKSLILYKLIGEKTVFILPMEYSFKNIAWWFGYINRRISLTSNKLL
jgi:glycosyltransferase involved in cell wall biosynthesis